MQAATDHHIPSTISAPGECRSLLNLALAAAGLSITTFAQWQLHCYGVLPTQLSKYTVFNVLDEGLRFCGKLKERDWER